jgi:hypothetical protein
MNNPNNLLSMMQTGGLTSTAGGAAFARVMQRRSDDKKLARQQRREARRQKKGRLFGSIAGLAGQGLGFLIGGSAGAAAGKALGTGLGQSLGAGKAEKYSRAGTVYNQDRFRDVSDASRDYNRGILGRSLLAGGKALAASALSPGGLQGAPSKGVASTGTLGLSQPPSLALDPSSALSSGTFGDISPSLSGSLSGSTSALSSGTLNAISPNSLTIPPASLLGMSSTSGVPTSNPIASDNTLANYLSSRYNLEDGGLAGYQNGGFTAQDILQQQGLAPTEDQLALFQSFDPTQIQQAKTGAEQSLMSMTGGMGLSSTGGGFGAKQRAATSAIGAGQDMIGDVTEQSQRAFESQTLGTAADLVAGGAEFGKQRVAQDYVPTDNPNWNPPVASTTGATYSFDGKTYYWDGNSWINQYMYDEDQRAQYDDGNDGYGGS